MPFFCFLSHFSFAFVGRFVVDCFFCLSFLYFVCLAVIILKFLSSGLTYIAHFILTCTHFGSIYYTDIDYYRSRSSHSMITHTPEEKKRQNIHLIQNAYDPFFFLANADYLPLHNILSSKKVSQIERNFMNK